MSKEASLGILKSTMEKLIRGIFCPPTGSYPQYKCPNRLTDEVFSSLKGVGINRLFGFGFDSRPETIKKTLELCEKYDIGYYPSLPSAGEYISLGSDGHRSFAQLSDKEKEELDHRFIKEVRGFLNFPAFKGIFFSDEAGYLSLDGLAHAKKVFAREFPNLEFFFNFYSYSINDAIFWGGMELSRHPELPYKPAFPLKGDVAIKFENRFRYYDVLVEKLLSQTSFEFVSQDKYPFEPFWESVPTSVHVALFELNAYFAEKKKKYHFSYFNYLQAGQWAVGSVRKKLTKGEMWLQANVTLGYGHQGFSYFPGCYPIDFVLDPAMNGKQYGEAGLIDINGKHGEIYPHIVELESFYKRIEKDLLQSEFLGVEARGEYQNGFDKEKIKTLPDNECIFIGKLPSFCKYKDPFIKTTSSNEIMISSFSLNKKRGYFITNLSSVYENEVDVVLEEGNYLLVQGETKEETGNHFHLVLLPGEAVYLKED